ncbi:MAG: pseudouridylate synthase [Bacteroidetes bacterium CG18_big_fil_WC_8_21_14_2_50_41_14]|nr:MAG: pseudouridylate synthase [Bacteroidetes bacterium CG18_big_fil_WC_8_21_14_2_50_41_14]PIY32209.1 MAG: pseudouridylate synthase [Bacteroidetes bacterium CG_4_10_14_3_um_filter_42_6]PJB58483.1 MAG: pseudouridylate synthase [Bacteroidetes bacterium CG_4_9_14_3_um_filter_41_19]
MNQKRNTGRSSEGSDNKRPYGKTRPESGRSSDRPVSKRSYGKSKSGDEPSSERPTYKKTVRSSRPETGSQSDKPFKKPFKSTRPASGTSSEQPYKKPYRSSRPESGSSSERPYKKTYGDSKPDSDSSSDRPYKKTFGTSRPQKGRSYNDTDKKKPFKSSRPETGMSSRKPFSKGKFVTKPRTDEEPETVQGLKSVIRLNKYLADAGICSRREADRLIESGVVEINGVVVTELGTKVGPNDKVRYGGESLKREKLKYVLLNKPKGFISTSDDPLDRKTVMSLVENACKERIYSVGRLDRNTTGLLLFTNDGDMAKRLTHPKHGVRKLYHVTLDKALTKNDMLQILKGVELEDGVVQPDKIEWVEEVEAKNEVGIELHSGKNRVVRRIFEHLGYQVEKLDRVVFAGLTKKDIPRGKWRLLSDKEVAMLKML